MTADNVLPAGLPYRLNEAMSFASNLREIYRKPAKEWHGALGASEVACVRLLHEVEELRKLCKRKDELALELSLRDVSIDVKKAAQAIIQATDPDEFGQGDN